MEWNARGELTPGRHWAQEKYNDFAQICPFSPEAKDETAIAQKGFGVSRQHDSRLGQFEAAYVGHVCENDYRENGSSGGMVSWVAAELLARGLIDGIAHVVPVHPETEGRFFKYRISRSASELREGAKSRYYPVEMSDVLEQIRSRPGRYAVVGVPCFIKAVQLLRARDPVIHERIAYTLGLFCGHMKSARFAESFAWQLETALKEVRSVEFRRKDPNRPANWYTAHLTLADGSARWQDWWHLADGDWGAGYFQNNACSYCDDVVAETADIAFGDAWVEPYSSDGRGTNVVIVRSREVDALIRCAIADKRLGLQEVSADFVAETQAAGLRQRREGLAYRLAFSPPRLSLRKRVAKSRNIPLRRKLIYRARRLISIHSHEIFWLSKRLQVPVLYLYWAWGSKYVYEGLAYLRGPLGTLFSYLDRSRDRD